MISNDCNYLQNAVVRISNITLILPIPSRGQLNSAPTAGCSAFENHPFPALLEASLILGDGGRVLRCLCLCDNGIFLREKTHNTTHLDIRKVTHYFCKDSILRYQVFIFASACSIPCLNSVRFLNPNMFQKPTPSKNIQKPLNMNWGSHIDP